MKNVKNSRSSRTLAAGGAALTLAIGAIAVAPHVMGASGASSDGALGEGAVSAVTNPGPTVELPDRLVARLADVDEIDPDSARIAASGANGNLYLLNSRRADRFCMLATSGGDVFSVSCAPVTAASTGKYGVPLPTGEGRPTPYVYLGVVPDGVSSVSTSLDRVPVKGNVFALSRPEGSPLGNLRYTKTDGSTVSVDPTSPE